MFNLFKKKKSEAVSDGATATQKIKKNSETLTPEQKLLLLAADTTPTNPDYVHVKNEDFEQLIQRPSEEAQNFLELTQSFRSSLEFSRRRLAPPQNER